MEDLKMYWVCRIYSHIRTSTEVKIICGSDFQEGSGFFTTHYDHVGAGGYPYLIEIPLSKVGSMDSSELVHTFLRTSPAYVIIDKLLFDRDRAIGLYLDSIYNGNFVTLNHGEKIPVEKLKEINLADVNHLWII